MAGTKKQEHEHIFLLKERWSGRQQNKAGKKSRPGPDSALYAFTGVEKNPTERPDLPFKVAEVKKTFLCTTDHCLFP